VEALQKEVEPLKQSLKAASHDVQKIAADIQALQVLSLDIYSSLSEKNNSN